MALIVVYLKNEKAEFSSQDSEFSRKTVHVIFMFWVIKPLIMRIYHENIS
jgi:hypothetical protein